MPAPVSFSVSSIADYLTVLFKGPVRLLSVSEKKSGPHCHDLKEYGYGQPLFLVFEVNGALRRAVLETMAPSSYGHDHFSDRAQAILWEHAAFNTIPRHVQSLDCGALTTSGSLISTGAAREFFLLTEFAEGDEYHNDLERISDTGRLLPVDRDRTMALSAYLAGLHSRKEDNKALYARRIRELLGHGECIMGLIDNYPDTFEFIDQELLRTVERLCWEWRWRIRRHTQRLCAVHGDFHPWNILFREGTDFTLLDRSRGEWGEPADDIACLSINFLFSSLCRSGKLEGAFEELFLIFWDDYLSRTNDSGIFEVIQPFFAFRGLVLAHPVWYPHLPPGVRKQIFNFIRNVMTEDRFVVSDVNRYCA